MNEDDYVFYVLDREIERVQKDRILRRKKLEPRDFKESKIAKYSLVIALILNIFFGGFGFFFFSLAFCYLMFILDCYIDYKHIKENNRIDKIEMKKALIDPEEYYYDEFLYQIALDKQMTEDKRKYEETLKKQTEGKKRDVSVNYSKDDEINILVEMIENYFYCYKLPPLKIKPYEWDVFFDVLYDEFKYRRLKNEYFHAVSEVIRYCLANTLVNDSDDIVIGDFINSLVYLHGTNNYNGILPDEFSADDVDGIIDRITYKIHHYKRKETKKLSKMQNKKRT